MGHEYLKLLETDVDRRSWRDCLRRCRSELERGCPIFLCNEARDFGMRLVMTAALVEKLGPWDLKNQPWGHPKLNPLGGYGELPRSDAPRLIVKAAIKARLEFVIGLIADLMFEDSAQDDCTRNHECPDCLLEENLNAPQAP